MDKGIFISYRREDSSGYTGRLSDDLNQFLRGNRIFRDIETIEPGMDFVDSINMAVDSCVVLLVVIGPRWLTVTNSAGERRLDDPEDYNRLEIATALKRGIRVVPVLVGSAKMPDAGDLPDDLKSLARRQAQELSDLRWKYDLDALISALEKIDGVSRVREEGGAAPPKPTPTPAPTKKPASRKLIYAVGGAVLLVLGAIGIGSLMGGDGEQAKPGGESNVHYVEGGSQGSELTGDAVKEAESPMVTSPRAAERASAKPEFVEKQPASPPRETNAAAQPAERVQEEIVTRPPVSNYEQAEPPRASAPTVPDLEGYWVDVDGIIYEFAQAGEFIEFNVYQPLTGNSIGYGSGEIQGRNLVANLQVQVTDDWGNVLSDTYRARVTLSADELRLEGMTTAGSTGLTTPVMLYRIDESEFEVDEGGY